MIEKVVVVGCGGQGREIGRMMIDGGYDLVGYVDDAPTGEQLEMVAAQGGQFLGGRDCLNHVAATHYVVGISSGAAREKLSKIAEDGGLSPLTFVHAHATVGADCSLGSGTILWPGARLTTNVRIGQHVHLNQNVTIGHDTFVADFVTLNPSAAVSGSVTIRERALVGAASVTLQGLSVGVDAVVGAAACVTRSVPDGVTAVGVPARW